MHPHNHQMKEQLEVHRDSLDSGLRCLATAAKLLGIPADYNQLKRAFFSTSGDYSSIILLQAARELGLKSKEIRSNMERLLRISTPALAQLENGLYVTVVKVDKQRILVSHPYDERIQTISHELFAQAWTGTIIMLARRFTLANMEREFNLQWFIPIIFKFKHLFGEVLIISFFLQSIGLITPIYSGDNR